MSEVWRKMPNINFFFNTKCHLKIIRQNNAKNKQTETVDDAE